ncbi:hypothetical protein A3A49_02770 [Candidatus Curtissbacteria bacterium RIFCSPLOWO2_01_FULL_38_11b]|uniref:DUF5660 domain-containing protein n=1 Tax=Candidatus Curtissbacteria bacterium RIFCSPLOWO2_01_FULL_38_11b TaxID=1797725 RepID=A0A1F5H1F5_9BACT|nr:MAG: hypothetical protein A3A49_02770 [Candidatus Curtissbacteria bacterium RIFCSPLOWO2_01_FULL_38_11b]
MNSPKQVTKAAVNAAKILSEPFEQLRSQVVKPIAEEFGAELGSFFGTPRRLGNNPKTLAQEDLHRARQQEEIQRLQKEDSEKSAQYLSEIKQEYRTYQLKSDRERSKLTEEVETLKQEVVQLAKSQGVETKVHLQSQTKKVGPLDIKLLTTIIRFLRLKAQESKSAKELISQRQNAKRTTGMLAWVSGKQMKVHEQGTLTLQG